jgi:hypothetical protein
MTHMYALTTRERGRKGLSGPAKSW